MARRKSSSYSYAQDYELSTHSDTDHFNNASTTEDEDFNDDDDDDNSSRGGATEETEPEEADFLTARSSTSTIPTTTNYKTPTRVRRSRAAPPPASSSSVAGDDEGEDDSEDGDDEDEMLVEAVLRGDDGDDEGRGEGDGALIVQSNFDAYFTQTASRAITSNSVFSHLVPPLTQDEFIQALSSSSAPLPLPPLPPLLSDPDSLQALFDRFLIELQQGFNILLYGYGSKRAILNKFAVTHLSKRGHVVVINAFQPEFTWRSVLDAIEGAVPGLSARGLPTGGTSALENSTRRVYDYFWEVHPPLFLLVHSLDSPLIRNAKTRSLLALLALNPHIHLVASVDHINSGLLFSTTELSTRKPPLVYHQHHDHKPPPPLPPPKNPPRGFNFLFHDLTTLQPYDFELAFADRTSITGAHNYPSASAGARQRAAAGATSSGGWAAGATANAATFSETAALHILASVTVKARQLFALMAIKQLESIDSALESVPPSNASNSAQAGQAAAITLPHLHAAAYAALFAMARDAFVATNDTAFRALLGEFRDHGLVIVGEGGESAGEVLWIPMRKERLVKVLDGMEKKS